MKQVTAEMVVAALVEALDCDETVDTVLATRLDMSEMDAPVDRESVRELAELYPGAGHGVAFDVVLEDGSRATVELSVRVTPQPRLSHQGVTPRERELEERDAALLQPLHRRGGR
jgi:hypothetical protein